MPWAWVSCYRVRVSARVTYCLIILSILRQGSSRPRPEIFVLEVSFGSRTVLENPIPCELRGSIPNMELGHWVTGSVGHLGHLSRPGHRVISLTWCETRVFPVFEKMPKMQNVHLKCWNDKGHCQVSVVGLKSLDVSPCNEVLLLPMIIRNSLAWKHFFTHKSTFGVHYRTGSPGQLGLRVAGFPGHWVTKCDPVPSMEYTAGVCESALVSATDTLLCIIRG